MGGGRWQVAQVLASVRGAAVPLSLVIASGLALVVATGATAARAQGGGIDCAGVTTQSSPATSSPVAVPPSASPAAEFAPRDGSLTVFAAASLTEAFGRIEADLEAANDGLDIAYNFAGSQALVTQLQEGAEADVFASANAAQMEAAVDNGSIAGEPVTFVRNRLAIVVPADNPAGIEAPADLADDGIQVVLAQPDVPVGRYARESLCLMGQDTAAYGEGFVDRVAGNVVSEEEDVRDVLARVQLGEADAGIVYVSDAAAAGSAVRLTEIPNAQNIVASYPIALVEGGDEALGAAFVSYVLSPAGQATLREFGFEPIDE